MRRLLDRIANAFVRMDDALAELPDDRESEVDSLARCMFDRQADTYLADHFEREAAWANPGVREFWHGEARAVLAHLGERNS